MNGSKDLKNEQTKIKTRNKEAGETRERRERLKNKNKVRKNKDTGKR